ncbi:MAG TPA: hypothetical protein VL992_10775 [Tepidisphaeraceae bacterium]|nr:hypothetical protein [Tepidisphaeraceae bacterium]
MGQIVFGEFPANAITVLNGLIWMLAILLLAVVPLWIAVSTLRRGDVTAWATAVAVTVLRRIELPQPILLVAVRSNTGWLSGASCRAPPEIFLSPPFCAQSKSRRARSVCTDLS